MKMINMLSGTINGALVGSLMFCAWTARASENRIQVDQQECLARNIYFEARGESTQGQIAVAQVTMNRVHSSRYPNTVCEVVYQRRQFSWTHTVRDQTPRDAEAWERAQHLAEQVIEEQVGDPTNGATHYHTRSVNPSWARQLRRTVDIGVHRFYKQ